MNSRTMRCFYHLFTVLGSITALWISSQVAQAQDFSKAVEFEEGSVEVEDVSLPSKMSFEKASGSNKLLGEKWLKISAKFKTTKDFIPEVEVKVFVEARDRLIKDGADAGKLSEPEKGEFVVLTGKVKFVDIAMSKEHYVDFFIHPASVERYIGEGGKSLTGRSKKSFNVRFALGGDEGYFIEKRKDTNPQWVTDGQQVPDVLLSVDDTPWGISDIMKYNRIAED